MGEEQKLSDKRKKVRKALTALLRVLEDKQNLIEKVHDVHTWNEILHELHELLLDYEKVFPDHIRQHLDEIAHYTDASPEKMEAYYQDLKNSLEQALHMIPAPPAVPPWIVAVVVVGGLGGAAGILYSLGFFATNYVDIVNDGCNTIQIPSVSATIPGLKLPENISAGEKKSAEIPGWLNVKIYTSSKDTITFDSWGKSIRVHVPEGVNSMQLNGVVLGTSPMSLAQQNQLVISCK